MTPEEFAAIAARNVTVNEGRLRHDRTIHWDATATNAPHTTDDWADIQIVLNPNPNPQPWTVTTATRGGDHVEAPPVGAIEFIAGTRGCF